MIEVQQLVKDYGSVVAVRGISFQVGRGEIVGVLGPNGAGKSTTLRILAGYLGATSGTVTINGFDIAAESLQARASLGYMPEASPLYPELRVREYLTFRARLKRVARRELRRAVDEALSLARADEVEGTLIGHLSKGFKQRVGLADALLGKPPLLILDEPTAGLDPNQIREVRALIRELGRAHTVLLSTHILPEVESTCDRAIVIHRGKLRAEGSIEELRARRRGKAVRLIVRGAEAEVRAALGPEHEPPRDYRVERIAALGAASEGLVRVELVPTEGRDSGETAEAAVARLVAASFGVREVLSTKATLEDVFTELTQEEPSPEERA